MSPRSNRTVRLVAVLALATALLALAGPAAAFCGFYVGGADKKLYNNATIVVLLREGTRTVLSMQNNYQGPPDDFAMVVPVPVVLQKENVKTLPREVFDTVDRAAAPRLVEYWEQDPCPPPDLRFRMEDDKMATAVATAAPNAESGGSLGVKVEAEFVVGEYNVVILSAEDALGLDTWLRRENYKIPDGAEAVLRPYVEGGMKFFVAKVIASKVSFKDGQAMLSPLRFHYDSEGFSLPIRLGLVNSSGTQDLLVHILHGSPVEEALPVSISPHDDRVEAPQGVAPRVVAKRHPIVAGLGGRWPALLGYNRIAAKEGAETVAAVGEDPLIAAWGFGKGRSVAFASDCGPHWAPPRFVNWKGYAPLWRQLAAWAAGR